VLRVTQRVPLNSRTACSNPIEAETTNKRSPLQRGVTGGTSHLPVKRFRTATALKWKTAISTQSIISG
jgi:hypothetical protein